MAPPHPNPAIYTQEKETTTMRNVTVNRDEFLVEVTANREAHREVFEEALDGYHRRLKAELEQRVRDLKAGRRINQYIGLPEPEDHTDDYDRVIMMAHMSVEDTITLSEDEFAMYVMDQWRWKQDFAETTRRHLR
jgi:hypothetical protein